MYIMKYTYNIRMLYAAELNNIMFLITTGVLFIG